MMRISTVSQLAKLINSHDWAYIEKRPSTFGLLHDYVAEDGSMIILVEGADSMAAWVWNGPDTRLSEVAIDPEHRLEILNGLYDNSHFVKAKGAKFNRRTTITDIAGKGSLTSTIVTTNGKTFAVETLSWLGQKGYCWQHRTLGSGIYHEWSLPRMGTKDECNRSHKEYLDSMETVILKVAQ